jgi:hypothetical protein
MPGTDGFTLIRWLPDDEQLTIGDACGKVSGNEPVIEGDFHKATDGQTVQLDAIAVR